MTADIDAFILRWKPSGGSEMANFPSFAAELTRLLGVEAAQTRHQRRPEQRLPV